MRLARQPDGSRPVYRHNPRWLSFDDVVASFCVRHGELDSLVEVLRACGGLSNQHQIVIGPGGSGKTMLLHRLMAEMRRDDDLSSRFHPAVLPEEPYEIGTVGEFWLCCLTSLADSASDGSGLRSVADGLRKEFDDLVLEGRALGAIVEFARRQRQRVVMLVENMDVLFGQFGDESAGWRVRKTLQNEPNIVLIASASRRFAEIDRYDHALYDGLRTLTLRPLDADACGRLWESVAGRECPDGVARPLEIITGGNPRLVTTAAMCCAKAERLDDVLAKAPADLVDEQGEIYKRVLDALPPKERVVFVAVCDLWKPSTAREIGIRASNMDSGRCSALLSRLVDRGLVVEGGEPRRKLYRCRERMWSTYHALRSGRGQDGLASLMRFMVAYYSQGRSLVVDNDIDLSPNHVLKRLQRAAECGSQAAMRDGLATAMALAVNRGTDPALEILGRCSDAAMQLVQPIMVALLIDNGVEVRVPAEVRDVANDIRCDLDEMRKHRLALA